MFHFNLKRLNFHLGSYEYIYFMYIKPICSTSKPPVWKTKYSKENNRRVIRTSGIQGISFAL